MLPASPSRPKAARRRKARIGAGPALRFAQIRNRKPVGRPGARRAFRVRGRRAARRYTGIRGDARDCRAVQPSCRPRWRCLKKCALRTIWNGLKPASDSNLHVGFTDDKTCFTVTASMGHCIGFSLLKNRSQRHFFRHQACVLASGTPSSIGHILIIEQVHLQNFTNGFPVPDEPPSARPLPQRHTRSMSSCLPCTPILA